MTLKQAQKQYDDAVQIKIAHESGMMTEKRLIKLARLDESSRILFVSVGKTISRIIFSKKAAII